MKMSSCRAGLEGSPVAQHRPQNVDPSARQGNEGLRSVPLAFSPLALVEGSGLRRATQAGEGRVVEDPFEHLVAPAPRKRSFPVRLPESWAHTEKDKEGVWLERDALRA